LDDLERTQRLLKALVNKMPKHANKPAERAAAAFKLFISKGRRIEIQDELSKIYQTIQTHLALNKYVTTSMVPPLRELSSPAVQSLTHDSHDIKLNTQAPSCGSLIRVCLHQRESSMSTVILKSTAQQVGRDLGALFENIRSCLESMEQALPPWGLPPDDANWLLSEVAGLTSDALSGHVIDLFSSTHNSLADLTTISIGLEGRTTPVTSSSEYNELSSSSRLRPRNVKYSTLTETKVTTGRLFVLLKIIRAVGSVPGLQVEENYGRIAFLPDKDSHPMAQHGDGFAAVFRQHPAPGQIPRTLTKFRIHGNDSFIFDCLRECNAPRIEELISSHVIHPNDRDQEGNTLLYVRNTALLAETY
jgi:hypothetical protein